MRHFIVDVLNKGFIYQRNHIIVTSVIDVVDKIAVLFGNFLTFLLDTLDECVKASAGYIRMRVVVLCFIEVV